MSLQVKFPFGRNHGPVHTCRDCGYATKERHLFDIHVKECPHGLPAAISNTVEVSVSPRKELPAPPVCRNYKCRKCEFATSKAKQYLFHLREVHKENITIYPCDLCEYAAKHRSKVIRHRTLVHKGAPAGDIDRLQTEPGEMERDTSDYIISDEEAPETVFVYQHSRPGGSTEIVFPGGGVPPPVPHILEQNIPAPVDAAEYSGPGPMEDQEQEVDEEDEEEEDMSGLEMDDEDPEIMFRVFSPGVGIELPEGQERPLVASDLPHNPHPTEDAYNYIIPAPGVEEGLLFKCKMCPYKNPHKWKIASHIRTIHMKRKLFKCPYCDFVCERKIEWCVHKTSHTNKTVYSCKECLYRTTMKRNFDRHLNRHLTRGPYKCGLCTYSSTGEAAIQRHQAEYHIESGKENTSPPLSCSSSSVAADESGDRFTVTDTVRSPSTPSTPKHTGSVGTSDVICRICGQLFRSEAKLRIHMVAHSSVAPWSCPSCPLRYKRPADLNRHMKRKHGRSLQETREVGDLDGQDEPLNLSVVKTEPIEQDAPLDLSLNSSPASGNIAAHSHLYAPSPDLEKACKALVFKPESLKCSHCSYQAKWPSDLRRHMLVHSIEKRFRCQFCNKRYKYQFDLNMHIRKTHRMSAGRTRVSTSSTAPSKPILTADQQLQLEWNTMTDVDPLDGLPTMVPQRRAWETQASSASSSGSSTSSSPSSRSPAIGTLVGSQCKLPQEVACTPVKLKCDYCPYVGKYRAEVERHMRLHTGNKPYSCLFCEYKSFWKGDMKRHLSKHHQGEVSQHGDLLELVNATYSPSSDVESSAAASRQKLEEEDESLLLDESIVKVEPLDADENPIYLQLEETNNNKVSYVDQYEQYDQTTVPIENMSFEAFEVEQPNAKPGDKKVFQCPQCAFVCEAPSKLKCHYEIHSNLKRYMCPTCGKRSNWLWDVRKHIRKDHPSASMEVTELTEEAASATLEEYLMTHRSPNKTPRETPTREIPTPPAGVLSSEVAALLELRIHSRDVSPAKSTASNKSQPGSRYRPYKCGECGRRSNWRWDLNKHIRTSNHPDAKVIVLDEEEAKATFEDEVVRKNREESPVPLKPLSPVSLQPVDIARLSSDRCRPFKCSKCGRRSNWKWDMSKHIRCNHPSARLIILSQEEARRTIDEYLKGQQQEQQQLQRKLHQERSQKRKATGDWIEVEEEEEEEEEDGEMEMEEDDDREDDSPAIRSALLRSSASNPGLHHHVDIQKLKRFKCSACPYRSNFRSDIGRHIKRKHINLYAKVTQLGYDEAATTLKQYRDTFAKKKFVPSPSKSTSSGTLESSPETSPVKPDQTQMQTGVGRQKTTTLTPSDEKSRFWKCTKCQFKSKNKMRVVKHYRKHARGMAFLCRICGETSDYRTSMYRHIRSKHHRQDFDRTVELTAVQLVQTSKDGVETILQSPEINNNSNNNDSAMAKYVWKNFHCRLCGSSSIYKGTIVRHIREKHHIEDASPHVEVESRISNSPPKSWPGAEEDTDSGLKCDMCPFQTTKEGLLQMHKTYHKPQAGNRYKCKYCPYFVAATRMLRQHTRLHLKEQGLTQDVEDEQEELLTVETASRYSAPSTPDSKASGRARHFCDRCPYVSINRNDYLYHKQFHRPKPTAPYKCELCPYWVSQRRLLTQHQKVHQSGYRDRFTNGGTGSLSGFSSPAASPCKSLNTDLSSINVVQTAHIKQRIIAGKITSVPITPEKLQASGVKEDDVTMPSHIVNRNGVLVSSGAYKKLHKCKSCPYTNVRLHNLKLHEKMHGYRKASLLKCQYCDYYVGNKGLLAHHVKVHSQQYRPGHDIINDFETEKENQQGEEVVDAEDGGQRSEPEEENNNIVEFKDVKPSFRPHPGTQLSASALPNKSSYYIKYDDQTGEHILERAIFKKWCCEKCPYATMKKAQFERHSMLHGSKQKYTCEYCDYSVPGYHLLLQHKKLHMLPNPNLLSVQSISNLHHLPEVPADIAAAANFPADEDDPSLALHDHLSLYENTPYFTEPKKLYRCDRCPYTNVRRDHLLAHLKFHMIRNEMTCPYCDYSVSKVHLLNQHIKVHFNTPGGEMSAQPAAEAASDGTSPKSVAAASDADQPEFIDISELGSKIRKDTPEPGAGVEKEEAEAEKMETDTEATKDGCGKEDKQGDVAMESSGEETVIDGEMETGVEETTDDGDKETVEGRAEDAQPPPASSVAAAAAGTAADGDGDEDEAKQSDEDKSKDDQDQKTRSEDGKKDCEDSWVCQYCDRAFSASEKLLRHEMQHLVGNKF